MDLQELAKRSNIPIRRLRHCVDEGLVPGLAIESSTNEIGRRRHFNPDFGFALCCAATLVAAGIDRSIVRVFLRGLASVAFKRTATPVIVAVFDRKAQGFAELGDNVNIRIRFDAPTEYDTKWVQVDTGARLDPSYQPLTTIGLNLGAIGKQVLKW